MALINCNNNGVSGKSSQESKELWFLVQILAWPKKVHPKVN